MGDPTEPFGMKGGKVFLEIGAGKGAFACGMAARHTDACYYAMERVTDCVVIAAERAASIGDGLKNLKFTIDTADNLTKIFGEGTVDAIFLNFSDPWSKKGYAKRRLTHRRYLSVYMNLLRDGGVIRFKTDNDGLFDFSLEEMTECGFTLTDLTYDLHNSEYAKDNVITEYEANFSAKGFSINRVVAHP
jgi:tRNA (guanine-N7-)-methyltransferase